jgi:hypothetical protein
LRLFNAAYFKRNLLKCLIVFDRFGARLEPSAFADFGAGAGVAGAAWTRMAKISDRDLSNSLHVDRSRLQLAAGRKAYAKLSETGALPIFSSGLDDRSVAQPRRISLFSFSLCEMMANDIQPLEILKIVQSDMIAIDFRETLLQFASGVGSALKPLVFVHEEYRLDEDIANALGQKTLKVSGLYAQRIN